MSFADDVTYCFRRCNELEREAAALRALVHRAGPFVNAVAVMADDRAPALSWLADAVALEGEQ